VNTSSTPFADQIGREQIRTIFHNSAPGLVTTLVTVFILTFGLIRIDATTLSRGGVFMAIMLAQSSLRLLMYRAYRRVEDGPHDWHRWALAFTVGAFAGGATIGSGAIWMVSSQHTELQLIALLVIFAVTGGAVGAFGAYLPAIIVFFVGVSVPAILWLFTRGDGLHLTIGGIFVLWFMAVSEQARRANRQFVESIRLRQENVELVRDLRREKALAEEANVAKSRFLAAASHDLRQPVHALSVLVGALRSHQMDAPARGLLDHLEGSVRALSGLFGGLLDISRLDAGVVEAHRESFALQPIIDRVCRDYESLAREKGVELKCLPTRAIVHSDTLLCERILRNIVVPHAYACRYGTRAAGLLQASNSSCFRSFTRSAIPSATAPAESDSGWPSSNVSRPCSIIRCNCNRGPAKELASRWKYRTRALLPRRPWERNPARLCRRRAARD